MKKAEEYMVSYKHQKEIEGQNPKAVPPLKSNSGNYQSTHVTGNFRLFLGLQDHSRPEARDFVFGEAEIFHPLLFQIRNRERLVIFEAHTEQLEYLFIFLEQRGYVVFRALAHPVLHVHVFEQEVVDGVDAIELAEDIGELFDLHRVAVSHDLATQNSGLEVGVLRVFVQNHVADVDGATNIQQLVSISQRLEDARDTFAVVSEFVQRRAELDTVESFLTQQKLTQVDAFEAHILEMLRTLLGDLDEGFIEVDAQELDVGKHFSQGDGNGAVGTASIEKAFGAGRDEVSHTQFFLQRPGHTLEIPMPVRQFRKAGVNGLENE